VINVDERGCADFVDARNESVIVSVTYGGDDIAMPVDPLIKCESLIGGIAADGTPLKAVIIVPRKTVEIEVKLCGHGDKHMSLVYQEYGSLSTTIFKGWIMTVLIPYVAVERRRTGNFGAALLILDG
jgi:hypothetical protein